MGRLKGEGGVEGGGGGIISKITKGTTIITFLISKCSTFLARNMLYCLVYEYYTVQCTLSFQETVAYIVKYCITVDQVIVADPDHVWPDPTLQNVPIWIHINMFKAQHF